MPIAKNLNKVQKKVSSSSGAVHPKGRKFKQLTRASLRQEKLAKDKSKRSIAKEGQILRVKYFKEVVSLDDKPNYSLDEVKQMIEAYISRDEDELDSLKAARRPGRPSTSRQDFLQNKYDHDLAEYKSGYNLPDLLTAKCVENLRNWNGTQGGMTIIKYIRISKEGGLVGNNNIDTEMNLD